MIRQEEYQARRKKLAALLPANSIAVVAAAQEQLRNGDSTYPFRQDSHFYYLTGFNEPEALLLISSGQDSESILFNRPHNPSEEQWTGKRLGQKEALSALNMDAAFAIDTLEEELPRLLSGCSAIYFVFSEDKLLEQQIKTALMCLKSQVRRGVQAPQTLSDLEPILSELRLIKSEAEIELLREAARISVEAHLAAMKQSRQLEHEYQLEAVLRYELTRRGCRSMAYEPIVGSGANACILHYTENNRPLGLEDLVLIDAGGEYGNYAADITRTFPVKGSFSEAQKAIYELVLKAHDAGIALIKPGVAWNRIQQSIIHILTEGLCELNILQGPLDELIATEAYKPFYMHQSGHWLGLDVHDVGSYKIQGEWRSLEPGMVLTVEPGLYISAQAHEVDPRWRGIGVRIEDDVLVTQTGHEILTAALPSTVPEIEALMRA